MNLIDLTLEEWLMSCEQAGPMPDASQCDELLMTAPAGAEQTAEHRFVSVCSTWRERRLTDTEVLSRASSFWNHEDERVAA